MHNNDFHSLWCKSLNLAGRCWTAERERSVASIIFSSLNSNTIFRWEGKRQEVQEEQEQLEEQLVEEQEELGQRQR